jgi:hypothetical protein
MSLPSSPSTERIEILEAFADLPDVRHTSGKRHQMTLCLALFTLAVTSGNRGFLAIGDWLKSYRRELIDLFHPPKQRLTLLQYDSTSAAEPGLPDVLSGLGAVF